MKPSRFSTFALAAALTAAGLSSRATGGPVIESVPAPTQTEPPGFKAPPMAKVIPGEGPPSTPAPVDSLPPVIDGQPQSTGPGSTQAPFDPLEQQKKAMEQGENSLLIKGAALNDIFEYLAKQGNRQYFHNSKIASPEYTVTGHLNEGNPLQQMDELAFMFNLTLYTKGNTVYALTAAQLAQVPPAEFQYQLRYLRPTDIEPIKTIVKPHLSPSGIVEFEPKTRTVIIIDSADHVALARRSLEQVDRAKPQVKIETKILRVNSTAGQHTGVDWSAALGTTGTKLEFAQSLNSIFGLPGYFKQGDVTTSTGVNEQLGDSALVLSPVQLSGVLRALNSGNLAKQVSNPTVMTEDSEQATIAITDRVPIITTTVTTGTGINTASDTVRYTVDASDKTDDPTKSREIGISMVVTPDLLPDGTIRMTMRPRSAQILEYVKGPSGNTYPHVNESMVQAIARVPDGSSLIVGGFYGESQTKGGNKIPVLGDIPVLNFFFKNRDATKEQTSLVFIVTPTTYDPANRGAVRATNAAIKCNTGLRPGHDMVDDTNPGPAHEPNFRRAMRGLQPEEAPYYSRQPDPVILPQDDYVPPQPPAPTKPSVSSSSSSTSGFSPGHAR